MSKDNQSVGSTQIKDNQSVREYLSKVSFSVFANHYSTNKPEKHSELGFWQVWDVLRTGDFRGTDLINPTNEARKHKQAGRKSKYDKAKNRFPVLIPTGLYQNGISQGLTSAYIPFLLIDIDGLGSRIEARKVLDVLKKDKHTALAFLSTGGRGVKALVLHTLEQKEHALAFDALALYYSDQYGLELDTGGRSVKFKTALVWSPESHVNPDAEWFNPEPYRKAVEKEQKADFKALSTVLRTASAGQKEKSLQSLCEVVTRDGIDLLPDYETYTKAGLALASELGEAGRYYFHALACQSPKYSPTDAEKHYNRHLKAKLGTGKPVGLGTIFWYAKQLGITFKKPRLEFAPDLELSLKPEQKIQGLYTHSEQLQKFWQENPKMIIQAGTGTGKTTFATRNAERFYECCKGLTIIALPTNLQTEQLGNELLQKKAEQVGGLAFTRETLEPNYLALSDAIRAGKGLPVIVTNYDMFPELVAMLLDSKLLTASQIQAFLDEQHKFPEQVAFRPAVQKVWETCQGLERVCFLSATPVLFGLLGKDSEYKYLKINSETRNIPRKWLQTPNLHATTLEEIKGFLATKPDGKVLVLLDSKKRIDSLIHSLEQAGIKADSVYRRHGLEKESTYVSLVKENKIPDGIQVVIGTQMIADGLNLFSDVPVLKIYLDTTFQQGFNGRRCKQFEARLREEKGKPDPLAGLTIITTMERYKRTQTDSIALYEVMLSKWKRIAEHFEGIIQPSEWGYQYSGVKLQNGKVLNFLKGDVNGIEVNTLALTSCVLEKEIYSSKVSDYYDLEPETSEPEKETAEQAATGRSKQQSEKSALDTSVYDKIKQGKAAVYETVKDNTKDSDLKAYLRFNYSSLEPESLTNRELDVAEQAAKWEKRFCRYLSKDSEPVQVIFNVAPTTVKLRGNKKLGDTLEQLRLFYLLALGTAGKLAALQRKEFETFLRLYTDLEAVRDKVMTKEELRKIVAKHLGKGTKKQKATTVVKMLFQTSEYRANEKDENGKRPVLITVNEPITLSDLESSIGAKLKSLKEFGEQNACHGIENSPFNKSSSYTVTEPDLEIAVPF